MIGKLSIESIPKLLRPIQVHGCTRGTGYSLAEDDERTHLRWTAENRLEAFLRALTRHGYTKHYFDGTRRLCSRLGGGFAEVDTGRVEPVEGTYGQMHLLQRQGVQAVFAGGAAISGGIAAPAAAPLGAVMIAAGGTQIILGLKDIMAALEGAHTTYGQHDLLKSACSAGEDIASSAIKNGSRGFVKSLKSPLLTIAWGGLRFWKSTHPKYKGIPQGATVK